MYPSIVATNRTLGVRLVRTPSVTVRRCGRGVDLEKYYATLDG